MGKRSRNKLAQGKFPLVLPKPSLSKPVEPEDEAESSSHAAPATSLQKEQERRIRKLQLKEREASVQIEKLKQALAYKEEQIGIHHVVVDQLKTMITCPLCMEIMVDPQILAPCGHSACLNCTYEHFRHANCCRRNDFQTEMITGRKHEKDTDIRQRTKECYMCRAPVKLRPMPFFLGRELIQSLQAAQPPRSNPSKFKPKEIKLLARPTPDMWRYTFLQNDEKPGYFDAEDDVFRCGCGAEVVNQKCTAGCHGTFDPRAEGDQQGGRVSDQTQYQTALAGMETTLILEVVRLRRIRDRTGAANSTRPTPEEIETSHVEPVLHAVLSQIRIGDMTMDAPAAVRRVLRPAADDLDEDSSEADSEEEEDERMSFIEYSDEGSDGEVDGDYDEEGEEREPGRGVKRRRVVMISDESGSDEEGRGGRSAPIEVEDSDSEAISDDFVPRSPPRSQGQAGSSSSRRIIIDSDDE